MRRNDFAYLGAGLVWFLVSVTQPVPTRALSSPLAELPHPFTQIDGIRELSEGRVVLLDRRDALVVVVDLGAGTFRQIGRTGAGPKEYEIPGKLFALPSGRSAVRDDGNGERIMSINADGTPGPFIDYAAARDATGAGRGLGRPIPVASDTLGRFYYRTSAMRIRADGTTELTDSSAIERLDLTRNRRDTVAFIREEPGFARQLGRGATTVVARPSTTIRPLAASDQWAVAPDGRIAVVSVDPYRVTYFNDGGRLDGPVIPFDRFPVTQKDKDEWLERSQAPQRTIVMTSKTGPAQAVMTRGPAAGRPAEWPTYFPPFVDAPLFAPDGRLWIRRVTSATVATTYEVMDGGGRLAQRVVLPMQSRVVGFGAQSIYVARVDDDGLQFLRRYAF